MKKKEIFIGIIAFILGSGLMYVYGKQEVNSVKKLATRVVDNCMQAFEANDELISNYKTTNHEFVTCITNTKTCNYEETANRILILNKERAVLESKILNISDQAQQIIDDAKKKK